MDLDTYIPIKLAGMFKRIKIYLDIVDPIAETKFRNFAYPKLFDWIECFIVSKSSRVILPGKSRIDYYLDKLSLTSLTLSTTPLICENVPKINRSDKFPVFNENSNNGIRIGYFGSLDDTRGILELIGFFKNRPDFRILIAGMGSLDDKIKQLSTEIDNLTFLGKYEPVEIQRLYSYVDFVWAYYSPEVFLHKYACPNKYYEHLAFKVPIIVNEIIPQSQKILQMNTGIVIDNELDDNCFSKMSDMILNYSYQLSDFDVWEKEYSNYSFSID
ncbi:glycosyltransferase [Vibrio hangzhouensis]|nr:glycosyltransferase [Vibrio hangzhouensis]